MAFLKQGFARLRKASHYLSLAQSASKQSSSAERSIAFGDRVTFLLRGQEKSNQKRRPPRLRALRASLPARSAAGLRGLSTGHPALTPNWFASLRTTLRADPPPARRFRGAPGRATRILRVLFRRARAAAKTTAKQPQCDSSLLPSLLSFSVFHRVRATMARCSTGAPVRR